MTSEPQRTPVTASAQMSHEDIVALFKRRQEAYDDLDAAALAADYSDDVIIVSPISGTHGKADAERNLRAVFEAFMDLTMTFEAPVIDGNRVAQLGVAEGTNIGGLLHLPPSGKTFKMRTAFIFEIKDGHIVREERIYDFTGMLVQVGILKAKPV